jgi:hypothetical protein
MRDVRVAPWMAVAAGLLVVLGVAACNSSSSASSAGTASQPAGHASSAAAAPASTAADSSAAVRNLPVSAAVRAQLLAAFAAYKSIPQSDVAGSRPGSTYYAYDPATATYWAMAAYDPASSVPLQVNVSFQDGGAQGLFKKTGSAPWRVSNGGLPAVCAELKFFPPAVLTAWSLPTKSSAC